MTVAVKLPPHEMKCVSSVEASFFFLFLSKQWGVYLSLCLNQSHAEVLFNPWHSGGSGPATIAASSSTASVEDNKPFHPSPSTARLWLHGRHVGCCAPSGAGQPSRHFNSEDGCRTSVGTIRKGLRGLSPQGSDAFLTFCFGGFFHPDWQLTEIRLLASLFFYFFVLFGTHPSSADSC